MLQARKESDWGDDPPPCRAVTALCSCYSGECLGEKRHIKDNWNKLEARRSFCAWYVAEFCSEAAPPVCGLWKNLLCDRSSVTIQLLQSLTGLYGILNPSTVVREQEEGGRGSMAKIRERQPSRRGPGRGASSRRPAADEHHHCCCCYCHRRARATPIQVGQFLEVGSTSEGESGLPAFGSVVFTLGGSKENEGINAHISVLFTKAPEGNEEGKQPDSAEPPQAGKGEESPVLQPPIEASTSGKEIQHSPPFPPEQAPPNTAKDPMDPWAGIPEGQGWSYIYEEEPED